jgi:LmbE family N-acetylglucosaminyl deacetylase
MNKPKKVVALAPHTDDGEFGCGGSIAKFIENGDSVYYVAFSSAEKSVPAGFPKDILRQEVKAATALLGIKPQNLILFNFEVCTFPQFRQEILEEMIKIKREIKPDLVFLPCRNDIHQDHKTIYEEGLRAFKYNSILGYEVPWNNLVFETKSFIYLTEEQLEQKIKALFCYKSQVGRDYADPEFIRSMAKVRGTQIGVKYAESFEVIRWIVP